jgi:HlyD family secretion protein
MTRALTAVFVVSALAASAQEPIARQGGDVHEQVRGLGELKAADRAEVRIPEAEAEKIKVGQEAVVDTGKGTVPARVSRVNGAVVEGMVRVELRLSAKLPAGVDPGSSIDAAIFLTDRAKSEK